jgi:hypothetical protein
MITEEKVGVWLLVIAIAAVAALFLSVAVK